MLPFLSFFSKLNVFGFLEMISNVFCEAFICVKRISWKGKWKGEMRLWS